jgi:hypothetical protein
LIFRRLASTLDAFRNHLVWERLRDQKLQYIPMGFFYFDESIHPHAKFTLGAFVYAERDLDEVVADALRQSGLTPRIDEFKSGARMDRSPQQACARKHLRSVVHDHCRIGIVVVPHSPRQLLGCEAFCGLKKILSTNHFESTQHQAFFDQGIFATAAIGKSAADTLGDIAPTCFFEQDSRRVLGLQVADLVAHTGAVMLLAELGLVKKMVKSGENSGYDPDSDMELEFELWAGVRYNFFAAAPPPPDQWESQLDFQVDVEARGLHVAATCDLEVRRATLARFGSMYLGCIH